MKLNIHLILCLIFLLTFCRSQQGANRSNLTITREATSDQGEYNEEWHFYDAYLDDVDNTTYLRIKTIPTTKDNAVHVFVSNTNEEPTYNSSEYKNIESQSLIIISNSFYRNKTKIVIGVQVTNTSSSYVITVQAVDELHLEKNMAFDFIAGAMIDYSFVYELQDSTTESLMFTAVAPNIMTPHMTVKYDNIEFEQPQKLFDNGVGLMVPATNYTYKQGALFNVTITTDTSTLLQIGVKHVPTDEVSIIGVSALEHTVLIMDNKSVKKMCYGIDPINKPISTEENTRHYMINIKSFTQNARFYVYDPSAQKEIVSVDVISSNYMQFDYISTYQLCVTAIKGNTGPITSQFQIYDMDYYYENQPYKEALVRGVTHEEVIPKGKVMYYRIPTMQAFVDEVLMNIHFIKGYPRLYKGHCDDYPNCIVKPEDIPRMEATGEIQTAHDINENIFLRAKIKDGNVYQHHVQTIAIVYCPDDPNENTVDCVFDISLKCEGDLTSLLPETRYSRPVERGTSDIYSFEVFDEKVTKIYVVLYSYSGNADLFVSASRHFEREEGTYNADGNREYVVIEKTSGTSLVGHYFARVAAAKNTYYTIFYYTETAEKKIFEVPSGEVFMETITPKEHSKTFYMMNRNLENNVPFLASVHSINCELKVHFDSKTYTNRLNQFVIAPSDPLYKDGKYKIEVEFVSFDSTSKSEDEHCLFYLAGDESMQENELLLNEGVFHQMAFNSKINYISYVYPLVYSTPARIVFSFNKYSDLNLRINYKFQGREGSQGIISTHHRKIEIEIGEIEEHCSIGEPCPLLIAVEPEKPITDPNIELRYQIEVLSSAGIPSYLTLGEIRYNRLNGKKYNVAGSPNIHYYYSDLAQGTVGEVVIDFLRGSGNAVAKVVRKDAEPSVFADWNRRVELPTPNLEGVKRLDYFDKKLKITENDTKECPKGCEIYIQVYTDNTYSEEKKVEYSIVLRRNDTVSALPLNEIITNTLYNTVDNGSYNYYQSTIYKDSNRLVLSVDCDLCVVFVNFGTEVPSKDKYHWTFNSSVKHYAIYENDPKIKLNTLYGTTFTIAVAATALDGLVGAYYNLKVSAPDRSLQMVHEINSAHDEICQIEERNGKCFVIIPIFAGESGENIYVYALNEGVNVTHVEIFAKFFDVQDYIKHSPEVLIENFPNDRYNEFSSANEELSALLDIPLKKRDVDRYLALTIQSSNPAELRILTTFFTTPRGADFRPHTNELFVLKPGHQLDLLLGGFGVYYTEFVVVQGEMTVYNDKDNIRQLEAPTTLDSEDVNTLGNIMNPQNLFIHHYIDATYKYNLVVFFVRYTAVTTQGYLSMLSYGRQNNLHYHEANPFPIEFYAVVKDPHKDILINLQLDQLTKNDKSTCSDDFEVSGYLVSDEWIISRQKDKTLLPDNNITAFAKYDPSLQMARVKYVKEDYAKVNSTKKYFYIKIQPVAENTHNYTEVATITSLLPINVALISVPSNEYYYGEIRSEQRMEILSFKKTSIHHLLMDIEYSNFNRDEFDFTLNPYEKYDTNIDYYKNSTYLDVVEIVENSGRVIFTIDASVFHEIHFALFRKKMPSLNDQTTTPHKDSFVVKYRSSKTYLQHFTVDKPAFNITKHKHFVNVTANFPRHSQNQFLLINTRFTLKFYSKDDFEDKKQLRTFSPKNEPVYTNSNFENVNNMEVRFVNVPYDEKDYFVTIEAVGIDASSSELLLYDVNEINSDLLSTTAWIIVVFFAIVIIVGGGVGVFFLYKKVQGYKGKEKGSSDYGKINDFDSKFDADNP